MTRSKQSPEADPDDTPVIEIGGILGRDSSIIRSGSISLSLGSSRTKAGHEPVLVPFMTVELDGRFGADEAEAKPSVTLTFDNVAFLFMKLGESYLDALSPLEAVAPGGLGAAVARLDFAENWLLKGAEALTRAAARLETLSANLAAAADVPAAAAGRRRPPPPSPKSR